MEDVVNRDASYAWELWSAIWRWWHSPSGWYCTGIAAAWCPVHGDCTCPVDDDGNRWDLDGPDCPLHRDGSGHADSGTERPSDDLRYELGAASSPRAIVNHAEKLGVLQPDEAAWLRSTLIRDELRIRGRAMRRMSVLTEAMTRRIQFTHIPARRPPTPPEPAEDGVWVPDRTDQIAVTNIRLAGSEDRPVEHHAFGVGSVYRADGLEMWMAYDPAPLFGHRVSGVGWSR